MAVVPSSLRQNDLIFEMLALNKANPITHMFLHFRQCAFK